jgi:hypothetical protein
VDFALSAARCSSARANCAEADWRFTEAVGSAALRLASGGAAITPVVRKRPSETGAKMRSKDFLPANIRLLRKTVRSVSLNIFAAFSLTAPAAVPFRILIHFCRPLRGHFPRLNPKIKYAVPLLGPADPQAKRNASGAPQPPESETEDL